MVLLADNSGSKSVIYQIYWVQTELILLNVTGVSYPNHTESITGIVNSLRKLSADEKDSITAMKIKVAEAIDGESIQDFSFRTKNSWNIETTNLINNLDQNTSLKAGLVFKIALEEPYIK